jgi:hypothetical protein
VPPIEWRSGITFSLDFLREITDELSEGGYISASVAKYYAAIPVFLSSRRRLPLVGEREAVHGDAR